MTNGSLYCFLPFLVVLYLFASVLVNEVQYSLAISTVSQPNWDNAMERRNETLSVLVVSIGASQRSQAMQRIIQELSRRGHRVRVVYPGTAADSLVSWDDRVQLIPVANQLQTKHKWLGTKRESYTPNERPARQPRITKIPQFSESPIDYTLRLLWHEKSAWKFLNYLPKRLLFPLRHWLFDAILQEMEKDKPNIIVADMAAFAAWDAADLFDIPLFLLYCGPLFPVSSDNSLKDLFLPPPLSGSFRNATPLKIGLFIFQKWLYEIHTSPALHKLNRLRWYQGLDNYRNIRDLFCRDHIYLFPTTLAFEIPRSISSHYLLSGPIVPKCTDTLPNSAMELAKLYSEQVVLVHLEGGYLSKVTTLSIVDELRTLLIGFWWMNGSHVQPDQFPNNFYSLQRQHFSCALSSSMVRIVVVPCLSDVVQEVLYFGKPVLCVATGAVQMDVAARLLETRAGESILISGESILDDLTTQLQDMFSNLDYYYTAAMQISLKIRTETCGLGCICNAMESVVHSSSFEKNSCTDWHFYSSLDDSLFYLALTYVVGYVLIELAKGVRRGFLCRGSNS